MKERKKLKEIRESHNISQRQAAHLLGISPANFCQIENGKRTGKIETWQKIQDLFTLSDVVLWEIYTNK